ncbi:unnamed protein product [Phyllotreta striolata]|uniref:Uncharacterized protein n=1 Tax=Phyllotreta striolata TaxID=444603 RepID=A0A9N9XSZ3_PHYSR|nr:unnamed protein product [Phyllotreta striolata]
MNKFFIVALCALALANAAPGGKDSSSSEDLRELAESIRDKYNTTLLLDIMKLIDEAKSKCPDIEDKAESVMEEIMSCADDIELGSDTFCSLIKKNYAKCTKPARDLVVSCLPEESKSLPALFEKIVVALIDNACSSTVEELLELFNPCALENDPESFDSCKAVKNAVQQHANKMPSKSLVCSIIPKAKNCAKTILDNSCKNTVTRNSVNKFYNAIDVATKDECDALNKA